MEIKITVESPDIAGAINNLADAIRGCDLTTTVPAVPVAPAAMPVEATAAVAPAAMPVEATAAVAPAAMPVEATAAVAPAAMPTEAPAPVAPAAMPTEAPAPVAPAEPAPSAPVITEAPVMNAPEPVKEAVTLEAISRAGAGLVDAGKMPDIMAALKKFGVQAITQLKPEEYESFAGELRTLGAEI